MKPTSLSSGTPTGRFLAIIRFFTGKNSRISFRGLTLKRKVTAVAFLMVFMLVSQILASAVMVRAQDDIPSGDFGIQEGMNDLIQEKDDNIGTLDDSLGDAMTSLYRNATTRSLHESVVFAEHTLPEMTEELVDTGPENVEIRTVEPVEPLYPRIFDLAEHYTPVNETDTVLETLLDGQDNYYIHTDYFTPDEERISTWTQGSLLPSLLDPSQGFKLTDWNGVNVDDDPDTGDVDKDVLEDLFGSFPEGSDIYVRVTAAVPLLDGLTSGNILQFVDDLLAAINGSNLEFKGGLQIQIRKDSFWEGTDLPVDVGILKGIGYQDLDTNGIEYLWIGDYNFSDVPQEFEFQAMLNTISIYLGEVDPLSFETWLLIFNMLSDLISGENSGIYDFASFAPPYTVNFLMDRDGVDVNVDDDDSIASFEFLLGYDKLQRVGVAHRVIDRTYITASVTPVEGRDVIAKQFHVKLHGQKNPFTNDTNYDSVEWYSRRPVNVSAIYSEGKLNDTYIMVDVRHMPYGRLSEDIIPDEMDWTSLRVTLRNFTTTEENFTRIHYESTGTIDSIVLQGFEYDHGYEDGHQYNTTYTKVRDIPEEITVEGNFILEDAKDPFTVFNNASLSFLNGIIDDAMLALASSLYAIGIKIRSIPDALSEASSTEGEVVVSMTDRNGIQDYLGMAELGVAYGYVSANPVFHARYAASSIPNHDYLMTYIDEGFSGVEDKVAIGLRFSGVGMIKYIGVENAKGEIVDIHVELKTDTTFDDEGGGLPYAYDDFLGNMPKLEVFYLLGEGDDIQKKDYARVALSNLPDYIKISLKENITIFDASDSSEGNTIINYVAYESLIDGQYMEFNVTHIPEYLKFTNNDTLLSVSTIFFPEDADDSEKMKTKYYVRDEDHMNMEFFISNETRNGQFVKRIMPSNYVVIYQNRDEFTLNGSRGVAAVSGRFNGLKSLYYGSDEGKNQIEVELRIVNTDRENLAIRLLDDSEYNGDTSLGLRGSAIIGPIPEYMRFLSERPEQRREVREPDTENIDGIEDVRILMDSVKTFGRSIVDVMLGSIDDTLVGIGMDENSDFWIEYSMHDPILDIGSNIDIIANISRGKISDMYQRHPEYSESYWTHGTIFRQEILDKKRKEAIFDLKTFMTGLPSSGRLAWNSSGDYLYLEAALLDFEPVMDWMVIDAKGVGDVDLLLHTNDLVSPMDMTFTYESVINSTDGTVDADIHTTLTSLEQPAGAGEIYAAVWSNASEFTRLQLSVPSTPSSVDLSVEIDNSLHLDYSADQGMDHVLMDMKIGDTDQLEELAYWTHGAVMRNGTDEGGNHIMDLKVYMEGIPDRAVINAEKKGDDTHVDVSVDQWKPDKDWFVLDLKGLNATDVFLYQNLMEAKAISMDLEMDLNAPVEGREVVVHLGYTASRDMGGIYLKFRAYGIASPVITQLYLPEVPRKVRTDLIIRDGISAYYSASGKVDHLLARLHRMTDGEWYQLTLMLHDVPEFMTADLERNVDFDPERSVLLQGNPNIRFQCSDDGMDVYLDMDGGVNGAYGHTHLQVGDMTNNTELVLKEPDKYSINSPGGVGYIYLVLSDLPILEMFRMNELYIYAEDARSVDIQVKQLFGLYPVFRLSNANGGRVHVKMNAEVGREGERVPLEAGVLDVRYRTIPFLAPLFVNDISTSLSTNHFIIPEPITTVVATVIAIIRGVGG